MPIDWGDLPQVSAGPAEAPSGSINWGDLQPVDPRDYLRQQIQREQELQQGQQAEMAAAKQRLATPRPAPTAPPLRYAPPATMGEALTQPLIETGTEAMEGLQQAFTQPYSSADPGLMEQFVTHPASQVMGLLRTLSAPRIAAGHMAGQVASGATQLPIVGDLIKSLLPPFMRERAGDIVGTAADIGSQMYSPTTGTLPDLLSRVVRPAAKYFGLGPLQEAERAASNLAATRMGAEQAGAELAIPGTGEAFAPHVSPLMRRMQAPQTATEAYAFLKEPRVFLPISTTPARDSAISVLQAAKKFGNADDVRPLIQAMGPAAQGKANAQQLSQALKDVGQLVDSSPVPHHAKELYWSLNESLRQAAAEGDADAKLLYAAGQTARQNLTAKELAEVATNFGTRADKLGQLRVNAEKLNNILREDTDLGKRARESFPPAQLKEIHDTLSNIFRAHEKYEEAKAVSKEVTRPRTMFERHPSAIAHVMSATGLPATLLGISHGTTYGTIVGAVVFGPELIFQAAKTRTGRVLLEAMFKDAPPRVQDAARYAALANFLKSQGQPNEPTPSLATPVPPISGAGRPAAY